MTDQKKWPRRAVPLTFLLIAAVLYAWLLEYEGSDPLSWRVEIHGRAELISSWAAPPPADTDSHTTDPESWYVFLPSYARMEDVSPVFRPFCRATLDGKPLRAFAALDGLTTGRSYRLRITGDGEPYERNLIFLRSENVATLFLDTQSGTMDGIYADRTRRETVQAALYTPDGILNCLSHDGSLKGRGQSSWNHTVKKSFTLTFEHETDLLNMGAASNWVLVSNAYDRSNLRNKLVTALAEQTGLYWTPHCEYVDLYLNGEYTGLYLLSERVEIGPHRLDIPAGTGPKRNFLAKMEPINRWDTLDRPFMTEAVRTVEVASPNPDNCSAEAWRHIRRAVQDMENAILSGDSAWPDCLDLDSWVRRYLVDEITENLDADWASSYFYCAYDGDNPVFYGGPVWDYDGTFGNLSPYRNINPRAFVANSAWEAPECPTPYYHALYQNRTFYRRVVELYRTEFLPPLEQLLNGGVASMERTIARASYMNQIRWPDTSPGNGGQQIRNFLAERVEFLNEAWLDGVRFHTVQVEPAGGDYYLSYAVRHGESFDELPWSGEEDGEWYDSETGELFDPEAPVEKDLILVPQWEEPEKTPPPPVQPGTGRRRIAPVVQKEESTLPETAFAAATAFLLCAALARFAAMDHAMHGSRRKKERNDW